VVLSIEKWLHFSSLPRFSAFLGLQYGVMISCWKLTLGKFRLSFSCPYKYAWGQLTWELWVRSWEVSFWFLLLLLLLQQPPVSPLHGYYQLGFLCLWWRSQADKTTRGKLFIGASAATPGDFQIDSKTELNSLVT
jgi:hypothetical protein